MTEETIKYLETSESDGIDFSDDIKNWLVDNWDPEKSDDELLEDVIEDAHLDGSWYESAFSEQCIEIINKVRQMEENQNQNQNE